MITVIAHGSIIQHCGDVRRLRTIGTISHCCGVDNILDLFTEKGRPLPGHFRNLKNICDTNSSNRVMAVATPYGEFGYGLVFVEETGEYKCFNYPYFDLTEENLQDAYNKISEMWNEPQGNQVVFYCTKEDNSYSRLYFNRLGKYLSFHGVENFIVSRRGKAGFDVSLKFLESLCRGIEENDNIENLLVTGHIKRNPGKRETFGKKALIESLSTEDHATISDSKIDDIYEGLVKNDLPNDYRQYLQAWNSFNDKSKEVLCRFALFGMNSHQFKVCFDWFGDSIGRIAGDNGYSLMFHPKESKGRLDRGEIEYLHLKEYPVFSFEEIQSLANFLEQDNPGNASYGWVYDVLRRNFKGDFNRDSGEYQQKLRLTGDELLSLAGSDSRLNDDVRGEIRNLVGSGSSGNGISCEDGFFMLSAVRRVIDYIEKFIERGKKVDFPWEPKHLNADYSGDEGPVFLLYGAAGTGKTTAAANRCVEKKYPYEACAFTGRASNTLQEKGLEDAKTIHRLLKVDWKDFQRFTRTDRSPGLVVVDEFSMVDIFLFYQLIWRLNNKTFLLVGDPYQLPPVKGINVFQGIIDNTHVRKHELTKNLRQEGKSIIALSKLIRTRKPIKDIIDSLQRIETEGITGTALNDDSVPFMNTGDFSTDELVEKATSTLKKMKECESDILEKTQVICPLKDLSNKINTEARKLFLGINNEPDSFFIEGEKVLQLVNDYQTGGIHVFNGEIGRVTAVAGNDWNRKYTIRYKRTRNENPEIIYDELTAIMKVYYGYCITVHKSQGSEYDTVILVLPQTRLLDLRLLYTAVTRAKRKLIIISSPGAIEQAWENGFPEDIR